MGCQSSSTKIQDISAKPSQAATSSSSSKPPDVRSETEKACDAPYALTAVTHSEEKSLDKPPDLQPVDSKQDSGSVSMEPDPTKESSLHSVDGKLVGAPSALKQKQSGHSSHEKQRHEQEIKKLVRFSARVSYQSLQNSLKSASKRSSKRSSQKKKKPEEDSQVSTSATPAPPPARGVLLGSEDGASKPPAPRADIVDYIL